MLEAYVAQFGPTNFARNTDMLWRLGQLLQRDNQPAKAKAYYRLALKHHRTDIRKMQLYYDSLEKKNQDLYVPLKTYYDLVEYRKNINTFRPPKGVYTSMGDAINSKMPDYGPALGGNDSTDALQQQAQAPRHAPRSSTRTCTPRAAKASAGPMPSRCPNPSTRPTTKARPA